MVGPSALNITHSSLSLLYLIKLILPKQYVGDILFLLGQNRCWQLLLLGLRSSTSGTFPSLLLEVNIFTEVLFKG